MKKPHIKMVPNGSTFVWGAFNSRTAKRPMCLASSFRQLIGNCFYLRRTA